MWSELSFHLNKLAPQPLKHLALRIAVGAREEEDIHYIFDARYCRVSYLAVLSCDDANIIIELADLNEQL